MFEPQTVFPEKMLIMDKTSPPFTEDILTPFAIDDWACGQVAQGETPYLHLWVHQQAMVAGIRDGKLPYADEAMSGLRRDGVQVGVRHSGGAAVPLDSGVLNLSLILPKPVGAMDFRMDFSKMVYLLDRAVRACGKQLQQGEIKGSYCPGDYDLSIQGRKFCGIAQRRQTKAIAIQAFVVVEGVGEERIARAQRFYREAARGQKGLCYPEVSSGTMASLAECGIPDLTVARFKSIILGELKSMGTDWTLTAPTYSSEEIEAKAASIRQRYRTST